MITRGPKAGLVIEGVPGVLVFGVGGATRCGATGSGCTRGAKSLDLINGLRAWPALDGAPGVWGSGLPSDGETGWMPRVKAPGVITGAKAGPALGGVPGVLVVSVPGVLVVGVQGILVVGVQGVMVAGVPGGGLGVNVAGRPDGWPAGAACRSPRAVSGRMKKNHEIFFIFSFML